MDKRQIDLEKTFVVEHCENCKTHSWNTRHDEPKYKKYGLDSKFILNDKGIVAKTIMELIPDAVVVINKTPKEWVDYDIYCQLVPNDDDNDPYYNIVPRTGAFEVSFKGVVNFRPLT